MSGSVGVNLRLFLFNFLKEVVNVEEKAKRDATLRFFEECKRRLEMEGKVKRHVCIKCVDDKDQMAVGNYLHEQLRGNQDYIDNNIILNIDAENEVNLYFFDECKEIPTLVI